MFQFLSDALTTILDFFEMVWKFVVTLFDDVVYIIQLLGQFIVFLFGPSGLLSFLPSPIFAMLSLVLSIVVIYKVAGKD